MHGRITMLFDRVDISAEFQQQGNRLYCIVFGSGGVVGVGAGALGGQRDGAGIRRVGLTLGSAAVAPGYECEESHAVCGTEPSLKGHAALDPGKA